MPKRVPALNPMQIAALRPGDALTDGEVPGLRVQSTRSGSSWALSVRLNGSRRWFSVGVGIGLAEARKRAKRMRQQIADGVDPAYERLKEANRLKEAERREKEAKAGLGTLRGVLDAYFEHRSELRSARTQRKALNAVFAACLLKPAIDLSPAMAQLVVDDYAKKRSKSLARAATTYAKPLFRWAGKRGLTQRGFSELERPAAGEKRQIVLTVDQTAAFLRSLGASSREDAVRLMLWTGARLGEACGATWGEFKLNAGVWAISGARRKNVKPGRTLPDLVIPLPRQAVAMLRAGATDDLPSEARVFVGVRGTPLRVVSDWPKWTRQKQAELGFHVTPHALRRTFATMLAEVGAPPHVVEAALGHANKDATAAAYNKSTYADETRAFVQRLADRLEALAEGGNVVALPRRA